MIKVAVCNGERTLSQTATATRPKAKPANPATSAAAKVAARKSQCSERFRPSTVPHLLVSDFAAAGLKQIYVVRIFSGCSNPQRYFVIALNSSTGPALLARQRADCLFETVLNMVVDQCLGLRNGLLSTACNCWATSRHGRCVSIMSMMPRK
jgi:hypothetical protein